MSEDATRPDDELEPIPETPVEVPQDADLLEPRADDLGLTDRQDAIDGTGFELEEERG
ncbi:hypothetical protein [Cellulomonas fimi]|uniref:Uncharacterized protein n=1 Tax=Cellulomonas fimi TaxID=1708 RepID=A0A7Y0QGC7_CELFI|nr:hypothetical protein [Cellulomonas fimi]NMR19095.1 hypothetical protein [Cellulomonas fimi]